MKWRERFKPLSVYGEGLGRGHPDLLAVAALVALWLLFFWRLFTPLPADQASLKQGDFSGQFVAFAGYQYARFSAGEVPLWNPYNNSGLPFIADTQAAVFYPPRLLTIALARLSGGWTYHALELEMTTHVLFYTLTMYALVRRMSRGQRGSVLGGAVAAVVGGYGGFLTGYPPLQLAILEAAAWLPLATLGIHEAVSRQSSAVSSQSSVISRQHSALNTQHFFSLFQAKSLCPLWLVLSATALGLSWMAGHPQTSYFLTLLLVAYLGYRCTTARLRWTAFAGGALLLGAVAFGLAAVQLLPGIEYLGLTARAGFSYDAKGNGFPVQDIAQFLFPGVVSQFSPLYVGVVGLMLALIALWRRVSQAWFWGGAALIALLWSFGANGALYPLLYNVLPGLRFFRGQERAAFLVANSLAILAGVGMARLLDWDSVSEYAATLRLRMSLNRLLLACLALTALIFVAWIGNMSAYATAISAATQATVVAAILLILLPALILHPERRWLPLALVVVLTLELFTVNMDSSAVYDPVPPDEQLSLTPPPLIQPVLDDTGTPFRVDGFRGLTDNYGSLYGVMDMRGISPLFLDGAFSLIEPDKINPRAWELFAVKYVYTDWQELPIPSEIIATGEDRYGSVNLHRLTDPRSFALLVYNYVVADSDAAARALLADPTFDPRRTAILNRDPGIDLPDTPPNEANTAITEFAPEAFTVLADSPTPAILSLSHVDYPGWRATIDDQPAETLRAYGALTALALPAGEHTIRLMYDPLTYRIGGLISLITWAALIIAGILRVIRRKT